MARPQTEKLKALNLQMCECGRLYAAKPGAFCKKCGPDAASATKKCKRGHVRPASVKRCPVCDKARRNKRADEDPAPVITDAQRAENREAAEVRAARRKGAALR